MASNEYEWGYAYDIRYTVGNEERTHQTIIPMMNRELAEQAARQVAEEDSTALNVRVVRRPARWEIVSTETGKTS